MGDNTYVLLPDNECAVRAWGGVKDSFCSRIQNCHGCEPLGALEYAIGWIEVTDYEDQPGRGQCEEADQHSKHH